MSRYLKVARESFILAAEIFPRMLGNGLIKDGDVFFNPVHDQATCARVDRP